MIAEEALGKAFNFTEDALGTAPQLQEVSPRRAPLFKTDALGRSPNFAEEPFRGPHILQRSGLSEGPNIMRDCPRESPQIGRGCS